MWVVLSGSLIGSGDVPAVQVGDVFTAGLELDDPVRIADSSPATDPLRLLAEGHRAEYEVSGWSGRVLALGSWRSAI